MLDPLLEQLLAGFGDESQEIYERVTRNLIELEKEPAQGPRFDEVARGLHTLKGSSATLGLEELADFAHRMEDVILPLRGSAQPLPPPLADAVLRGLDTWMASLRATAAKTELPDLRPAFELLERVKPGIVQPKAAESSPSPAPEVPSPAAEGPSPAAESPSLVPEEPQTAEGTSWRVSTRQVIALMHEVERFREVRLRLDERRRDLDRTLAQLAHQGGFTATAETAERSEEH